MKISQIKFKDWRCFKGEEKISFSTDRLKPISVVYGTNGSGKTTILNAVLWALWDVFTPDFLLPGELVNSSAFESTPAGKKVTGFVEIKFEHAGSKFTVERTVTESSQGTSRVQETQMAVLRKNKHGESLPNLKDKEAFELIDQLFPKRLAKYFFFNGEKFVADAISPSGQKEFGQAVRHVLGLTVYDRALQHVKRAIEELDKSIAQLDNDDDLKKLTVKKTFINDQILELESKVKDSQQKIDSIQTQSEGIDNELKAFEKLKESIESRKKYEADISAMEVRIKEFDDELTALIGSQNTSLFLLDYENEIIQLGDAHRRQKHIPADFKESFIRDLLNSGECICGEPLKPNEKHYNKVRERLVDGGLTDTEEEWTLLVNSMKHIRRDVVKFNFDVRQINESREDLKNKLNRVGVEIDNLTRLIKSSGGENPRLEELEGKRTRCRLSLVTTSTQLGRDLELLEIQKKDLQKINTEIDRVQPRNVEAQLENKRKQLLVKILKKLELDLDELNSKSRKNLESKISQIFASLSFTKFVAVLNEDFVLKMHRTSESGELVEAAMGTGDRQLSFYSFIAALSEIDFSATETEKLIKESFPIMIDAPFSMLDRIQKVRVINALPTVTHQLVLMMLEVQSEVMNSPDVLANTQSSSVLVFHSSKTEHKETINLPQRQDVPYIERIASGHHYTKVVQIQ